MGLLHPKGSTLSGLEAPSSLRFPPSNRCGSPSRNTTSLVLPLYIANVSKPHNELPKVLSTLSPPPNCDLNSKLNFFGLRYIRNYILKTRINPILSKKKKKTLFVKKKKKKKKKK